MIAATGSVAASSKLMNEGLLNSPKAGATRWDENALRAKPNTASPGRKMINSVANLDNFARKFHAERRTSEPALERFLGQDADALQNVPEVETRRLDTHGDLPGSRPRDRDPLQDRAFLSFSLRKG